MYFTYGQDRAFEHMMREKPGFSRESGAQTGSTCEGCHYSQPDSKRGCRFDRCPYRLGKSPQS